MKNGWDLPQGESNSRKQILTTGSTKEKGTRVALLLLHVLRTPGAQRARVTAWEKEKVKVLLNLTDPLHGHAPQPGHDPPPWSQLCSYTWLPQTSASEDLIVRDQLI